MSQRHILFMVTDLAPLPSIGRLRTQKFCHYLPEFGWRTSVLTVDPPPGTLTDPKLLQEIPAHTTVHRVPCPQPFDAPLRWASKLLRRRPAQKTNHDVTIDAPHEEPARIRAGTTLRELLSRPPHAVKTFLTRHCMIPDDSAAAFFALAKRARRIIQEERVDLLVASVPGFTPWLAAAWVSRRTGVPLLVDYRDLWYGDVLRHWIGPMRRRFELGLERWALKRTAAVVTVSASKTEHVRRLDPAAAHKPFETIYNGFDPQDTDGIEPHRAAQDAGRLVLVHAGKLYGARRIDPLLEAIGRLVRGKTIDPRRIRLRLLGTIDAPQKQRLDQLVRHFDLDDLLVYDGYVTRRHALARQLGADALVLVVDPGQTAHGVIPGKLTEYIGLGRYILALCPPGESQTLLERYAHAGWASADDPHGLEHAVAALYQRWRRDPDVSRPPAQSTVVPTRRQNAGQFADLAQTILDGHAVQKPLRPAADRSVDTIDRQRAWSLR